MKTYALYLLMLCFSVIGCQKDTGDDSKPKGKKAKKYLPVEIARIDNSTNNDAVSTESNILSQSNFNGKLIISYKDDNGNIKSIGRLTPLGDTIFVNNFTYINEELSGVTVANGDRFSFESVNGKINIITQHRTMLTAYPGPEPQDPVEWREEEVPILYSQIYWKNNRIDSIRKGYHQFYYIMTDYYQYNDECQLSKIIPYNKTGYITTLSYSAKNYWAKDVRNKEALSIALNDLFYPTCKDIQEIQYYTNNLYPRPNYTITVTYENVYNEDDYPEVLNFQTVDPIRGNSTNTLRVTYKVIE